MPLNQRQVIAEAIEGRRYYEWGGGGSTLWLAKHARPEWGRTVESDPDWFGLIYSEFVDMGKFCTDWKIRPAPCRTGANATIGEEQPKDRDEARAYVEAGMRGHADVYLIDGVIRGDCLRALVATGRPMTIFLHDTQRDWYDDAIQEAINAGFERTDYPEGDDYPGCLLTKLEKQ